MRRDCVLRIAYCVRGEDDAALHSSYAIRNTQYAFSFSSPRLSPDHLFAVVRDRLANLLLDHDRILRGGQINVLPPVSRLRSDHRRADEGLDLLGAEALVMLHGEP